MFWSAIYCETFFLNATIINEWKEILNFKNVFYIQQFQRILEHPFRYLVDYCSGTSGVLYGYCLSPKKIHILGCDCDYVEFIPECKEIEKDNYKKRNLIKALREKFPEVNPGVIQRLIKKYLSLRILEIDTTYKTKRYIIKGKYYIK